MMASQYYDYHIILEGRPFLWDNYMNYKRVFIFVPTKTKFYEIWFKVNK